MSKTLRQLGFIETQMALFHAEKPGTTQGIQLITLEGQPQLERLEAGLAFLHRHYQALRCRIRHTEDGLFFEDGVPLDDVELRVTHLHQLPGKSIDEHVTQQLAAPLDDTRALWAIHAVRAGERTYLILKFHHAIIDGDGLSRVASVLLRYLDGVTPSEVEPESLAPAIDEALRALPQKVMPSGSVAAYAEVAPIAKRATRFRGLALDASHSQALREFASRHKLAVNSVLAAIMARAFHHAVPLPAPLEVKSAVSLREGIVQLPNPAALGCYIGVASANVTIDGKQLHEIATEYQQKLYQDVLYSTMRRSTVPFQPFRQYIRTIDDGGRFPHGIGITNLGELKLPQLETIRIVDYATLNGRNAGNVAVVTNALELFGTLRMNLVYCEPLMHTATIEQMARAFERQIAELAS